MKYFHWSKHFGRYRIGFYQEPIRWGLGISIHLPNEEWKEGLLIAVKVLMWSVDFETEYSE